LRGSAEPSWQTSLALRARQTVLNSRGKVSRFMLTRGLTVLDSFRTPCRKGQRRKVIDSHEFELWQTATKEALQDCDARFVTQQTSIYKPHPA